MVAGACGGSEPDRRSARVSPSPRDAAASPGANSRDGNGTDGGEPAVPPENGGRENGGSSGTNGGDARTTPRPTAPADVILPPQAERYEYTVTGTRKTPGMASSEAYPDDARLIWNYKSTVPVSSWVEITYSGALAADQAEFEHTIVFRRAGLRHAWWQMRLPGPRVADCRFEPRIEYANAPMRPETYPTQNWAGPACTGTSDYQVVEQTDVKDANGNTWRDVWRVEEKTTYTMQATSGTRTVVHWFSHDQGVDVRTDVVDEGTSGTDPFRYEQTILLAKRVMPKPKDD